MGARRSAFDWFLEAVAFAAIAGMFVGVAVNWNALPDLVPRHFSQGFPDAWGAKRSVWVLPGIAAALYLMLTILSFFPGIYATPLTVNRDDPAVRHLLAQMMLATKATLAGVFAWLNWARLQVALGEAEGIPGLLLPLLLIACLAPAGIYAIRLVRYRQ